MLSPNKFDEILTRIKNGLGIRQDRTKSGYEWFVNRIKVLTDSNPYLAMDRLKSVPFAGLHDIIGSMFYFAYDPKWKKKLPYYDTFPLIFPIEIYDDGFLGINFHYLPYATRARLFKNLLDFASNKNLTPNTRLKFNYRLLKGVSQYKEFQPCVHRYLTSHVMSDMKKIDPSEWEIALFLPVANFEKKSEKWVWTDSLKKMRN